MPHQIETQNRPNCPFCGSNSVWKCGKVILSEPFRIAQRYQCKSCGKRFYIDPLKTKPQGGSV